MKMLLALLVLLSYMNTSMLDNIADNEDDDTGQVFHISTAVEYSISQPVSILQEKTPAGQNTSQFADYRSAQIKTVSIDIITPPPDTRHIS